MSAPLADSPVQCRYCRFYEPEDPALDPHDPLGQGNCMAAEGERGDAAPDTPERDTGALAWSYTGQAWLRVKALHRCGDFSRAYVPLTLPLG